MGDVDHYCQVAVAAGMETLGFSDHCPLADGRWSSVRMANDQLDEYIAAVHDATVTYPNLKVLLGLECEYLPELKAWYVDDLYGGRKFDYLVGGAHYFPDGNGWTDTYGGTTDRQSLLAYADYVVQMIESGLFAFIAHLDLFGNCYPTWDAHTQECSHCILTAAAACNVGLETNALGLRKIAAKPDSPFPMYPWRPFWEQAQGYGVRSIVNSDAHRPGDLEACTADADRI